MQIHTLKPIPVQMRAEKKLIRNPISSAFDLQHLQKSSFDVAKNIFQVILSSLVLDTCSIITGATRGRTTYIPLKSNQSKCTGGLKRLHLVKSHH